MTVCFISVWFVFFRPDGHQNNLRSAAYEALMEIVKNSAKDCYPAVQKTTLVIMERLQQVLQMEVRKFFLQLSSSSAECLDRCEILDDVCLLSLVSHPEHIGQNPVQ